MTDPHPDAAGSRFAEFQQWTGDRAGMHPKVTKGHRWWQNLVAHRALEVDAAGRFCWDTVVLSTPRQTGKSWLLRELCLWRLSLGPELGEVQTVLHTAMKLKHAQAVWYPAARWALGAGLKVRFTNGEQLIEEVDGSAWSLQAANDGLGVSMSVSLALVDEAWGVGRDLIDNALVPTLAESEQPQLWLVSTAGVPVKGERVTDLMPAYRQVGMVRGQSGVLFVEWSAPLGWDPGDPVTWRAGSAFWDPRREATMGKRWGMADTDAARVAFRRQWLNQWDAAPRVEVSPAPVLVDRGVWDGLRAEVGVRPVAVGVEAAPGGVPVVASAGVLPDGRVRVGVRQATDMGEAARWCRDAGVPARVGKSLLHDPVWLSVPTEPMSGTGPAACSQLLQLVGEGVLAHDGGEVLGGQVTATTTRSGPGGTLRITSPGRVDAIKAAVWAVDAARSGAVSAPMIW
jgi:hypothetical protein